jgi:hypothetical protein
MDLRSVHSLKLAPAVGQSCGRKKEKELIESPSFDRFRNHQCGTAIGNILDDARAPPIAIMCAGIECSKET